MATSPDVIFQNLVKGEDPRFQFDFRDQDQFFRSAGQVAGFDVAFSTAGGQEFFQGGERLTGAQRQEAQRAAGGVKGLEALGFTQQFTEQERALGNILSLKLGGQAEGGDAAFAQQRIEAIRGTFIRENQPTKGGFIEQFGAALNLDPEAVAKAGEANKPLSGVTTTGSGFDVARTISLGGGTQELQFKGGGSVRTRADGSITLSGGRNASVEAFLQANALSGFTFFTNDRDRFQGKSFSVQPPAQPAPGQPGAAGTQGTTGASSDQAAALPTGGPLTVASDSLQDIIARNNQAQAPVQAQNPLIAEVQGAQQRSVLNQQALIEGQAGAGRQNIIQAAPELGQASQALLQQARDPGGGGFREDFQERIRVQQAAAGLSGGGQAAFQEAALTSGALQQRRLQAGQQLQQLGGTFLQQLGLGRPISADLAGIGQTQLAGQTLEAITAANQAQSQISQDIFNQISAFLTQREETRRLRSFGTIGGRPITGVNVGTGAGGGGTTTQIGATNPIPRI
jgi:hypothetical protein